MEEAKKVFATKEDFNNLFAEMHKKIQELQKRLQQPEKIGVEYKV